MITVQQNGCQNITVKVIAKNIIGNKLYNKQKIDIT